MTSSTVFVVAVDTIVIVACLATLVAIAAAWAIDGRRQRRRALERILALTVAELYWPFELEIVAALRRFDAMKSTTLFDDVSAFDVLVHKYRNRQNRRWQTLTVPQLSLHANSSQLLSSAVGLASAGAGGIDNVGESVLSNRSDAMRALEKIERLFDVLSIRLPIDDVGSVCPPSVVSGPFARTVSGLARETAAVWPGDRASAVRRLVAYFGRHDDDCVDRGWRRRITHWVARRQTSVSTIAFDTIRASCCGGGTDASVDQLVRSRLPYVDALRLSGWHFVLTDVITSPSVQDPNSSTSTIVPGLDVSEAVDVCSKVRFIDERLSRLTSDDHGGGARALSRHRWPELVAAYNEALDLAVGVDLVAARSITVSSTPHHHYPDFTSVASPPLSMTTDEILPACPNTVRNSESAVNLTAGTEHIIVLLRHLVRLICASDRDALRRPECDKQFAQFVTRLHDALYGWSVAPAATWAAVERCRANVIAYARSLAAVAAAERLGVVEVSETDTTLRQTLAVAEADLYLHLDLLTRRRVELAAGAMTRSRARKKSQRRDAGVVIQRERSNDDAEDDFRSAVGEDDSASYQHPLKASNSFGRWLRAAAATVSPTAFSSVSSLPLFSVGSEVSVYTLAASHIASPQIEKIQWSTRPEDVASIGSSRSIRLSRDQCCAGNVPEDDGGSLFSGGSFATPYASLSPTAGGRCGSLFQSFWGFDVARREPSVDSPTSIDSKQGGLAAMGPSAPTTPVEFLISSEDEYLETLI